MKLLLVEDNRLLSKNVTKGLTKKGYAVDCAYDEQLIEHVWDSEADLFSNSFKFLIHSLKKKLEAAGAGGYVVNVHGQGYRIGDEKGAV